MGMFGKTELNVVRYFLALTAILFISVAHGSDSNDPIVPSTKTLCPKTDHVDLLACLDSWYGDLQVETVPLSLDTGFESPELGGIFSSIQRIKRAEDGSEMDIDNIKPENLAKLRLAEDPANAYRVLSASPTARNLFLSLDLLAAEVLAGDPTDIPVAYLFLTKIVESTLYFAATEDERNIYAATESFRNCVQLTLIDRVSDRLLTVCLPKLHEQAEIVAKGL